ncbi:hypothetical protein Avbf_15231 [Armadillidium vulgare]|nr:hypothetical protein Avbf_15231 [Armadillidium vulgare]
MKTPSDTAHHTCAISRIDHEEEYLRYVRVLENSLRKLKKEVSMNHLMDLVQYLGQTVTVYL